jgi:membrane-associated phospholipid phosphatase
VALSWLAVFAAQVPGRSRIALAVLTVGISVSTLFVKQHYIADVVYGFTLALLAWRLTSPFAARFSMTLRRARRQPP